MPASTAARSSPPRRVRCSALHLLQARAALLTAAQCATYDELKLLFVRGLGWEDNLPTHFTGGWARAEGGCVPFIGWLGLLVACCAACRGSPNTAAPPPRCQPCSERAGGPGHDNGHRPGGHGASVGCVFEGGSRRSSEAVAGAAGSRLGRHTGGPPDPPNSPPPAAAAPASPQVKTNMFVRPQDFPTPGAAVRGIIAQQVGGGGVC